MVILKRIWIFQILNISFVSSTLDKNRILVRTFSILDIILKLEILHRKLSSTASGRLSPTTVLSVSFVDFVCVFVFLFVFF